MMTDFIRIPLDAIEPSTTNPRQHFDEAALAELAETIKVHGVITPVAVRPHPRPNGVTHQLISGERRWRASKLAGVADIPAIVEDIDEAAVAERQLVENAQRVDLTAMEEASTYERLMNDHGLSIDDIIARTGRSKSHVYSRIKLLSLAPAALAALHEGRLSVSVAEMIARIPSATLQGHATADCLGESDWRSYETTDVQPESINAEGRRDSDASTQPLSFRAAAALIRKKYHLKLELARFDTTDAELVPEAGACTTCVHRSGNQPELALPGIEKTTEDLCTNPPCFEAKTQAAWKRAADEARARGLDVVEGKKAEAIFVWNGEVQPGSPYVDYDTRLPYDLDPTGASGKTFGKLLGKLAADVPRVLVQGPSGEPRELLVKAKAIDVLREAGKLEKPAGANGEGSKAPATKEDREAARKAKARAEEKERAVEAAMMAALGIIAKGSPDLEGKAALAREKWRASALLALVDPDDESLMLARRGLDSRDDLAALVDKAKTVGDVNAIIDEYLVSAVSAAKTATFASKEQKQLFDDVSRLFHVDFAEQVDIAKEAMKAAKKADEDKVEAKVKKKGGSK